MAYSCYIRRLRDGLLYNGNEIIYMAKCVLCPAFRVGPQALVGDCTPEAVPGFPFGR